MQYITTPQLDSPEDVKRALLGVIKRLELLEEVLKRLTGQGNVEPTRPVENGLYWADGTNWDPGSGPGIYKYVSGTWTLI